MIRTYAATARARLVDEPAQDGERALGAGRDRLAGRVVGVEAAARRGLGPPALDGRARSRRSGPPARGWAGRRRGPAPRRPRSRPGPRPARRRSPRDPRPVPTHGRGGSPRSREQLPAGGPVGVHAVHARPGRGRWRRPSRSRGGRSRRAAPPPARDRRCRPRPPCASSWGPQVVLGHRHRERERDPAAEAARVRAQVAVDDLGGQRAAVAVEAGDAEQAQDRPLLADRRGRGRGRSPGGREPVARDSRASSSRACASCCMPAVWLAAHRRRDPAAVPPGAPAALSRWAAPRRSARRRRSRRARR